jgi:hypothetical protein
LKSTGIIAFVLSETFCLVFSISRQRLSFCISTNETLEPARITELGDATNVRSGIITSLSFSSPSPCIAMDRATVPLVVATAYFLPTKFAKIFSNSLVFFDSVYQPESITLSNSFFSSSP